MPRSGLSSARIKDLPLSLSRDAQRSDAKKALELLKGFPGVSLTEVVQFYRKHFMPEGRPDAKMVKLISA
jgi:hypothetical protein